MMQLLGHRWRNVTLNPPKDRKNWVT
jgi:hypothetical protein